MQLHDALVAHFGSSVKGPGSEIRFCCTYCVSRGKPTPDTKYHLYLNTQKKLFICQRCGMKGSAAWLLESLGVSIMPQAAEWGDVVRRLRLFTEQNYDPGYDPTEEIEYPCPTLVPQLGLLSYRYLVWSRDTRVNGLPCRGLTDQILDDYHLRVGSRGGWVNRIFIPTFHAGKITFWCARDFSGSTRYPKYMNPPHRNRRHHVFNLDRARGYADVIITEGVFSAIAAGPNAVATFGKMVTVEQLQYILAAGFRTHFVALDGDAKPQALYVARWLSSRGAGVKLVKLPPQDDPDSVPDFKSYLDSASPFSFRSEIELLLT